MASHRRCSIAVVVARSLAGWLAACDNIAIVMLMTRCGLLCQPGPDSIFPERNFYTKIVLFDRFVN